MKKKKIIISIILIIIISCIIFINYDNTNNTVLMDEEKEIISSSNISMMLETGVSTGVYEMSSDTSWPTSGYIFNEILSGCENGSTLTWDSTTGSITVSINVNDKCYIYFDVEIPKYTISEILATKTIDERTDFSVAFTEDTTGIVYQTTDNDGYTYYWAGDATDNYVYFAGFYWRIVRVNGDGTLRLIYDGTEAHENGEESEDRTIGSSIYYSIAYNESNVKSYVELWYNSFLLNTEYEDYVYQSGQFCDDVEVYYSPTSGRYVYYMGYNRLVTNKSPSLVCSSANLSELNIGIITADEIAYAGGVAGISNDILYLYTGYTYWTMTSSWYNEDSGPYTKIFTYTGKSASYSVGSIGYSSLDAENSFSMYVKPVINLNSDVLLTGSGTIDSPYEVYMG